MSQYFIGGGGGGGTGDVVGPASSTDNAIVRFDGTTGKLIQNGVSIETDAGEILAGNGSYTNPAFSFISDSTVGFYGGVDFLGIAASNIPIGQFTGTQNFGLPTFDFIGASALLGSVSINASTPITTNYNLQPSDCFLGVTDTSVPLTITLNHTNTAYYIGRMIYIKDETGGAATNNITIDGGGFLIDGQATKVINTDYGSLFLIGQADGNFATIADNALPAPAQPLQNLGFTWDGNVPATFSVTSADGTALSGSNKGWLSMPSNVANLLIGLVANYDITADQSFTDSVAGDLSGMRFGVTTGVDWLEFCPFFVYAVSKSDDSDIAFMISRVPGRTQSPAAASIGKAGSIVNNGQDDFFCMKNVTVSDYAQTSCICIGALTMKFDGATDSWYVAENGVGYDFGVGCFGENTVYNFPAGQNGADTGIHFSTAGTFPTFISFSAQYTLDKVGNLRYTVNYSGLTVDGTGTDEIFAYTPMQNLQDYFSPIGLCRVDNANTFIGLGVLQNAGNYISELPLINANNSLQCDTFTGGGVGGFLRLTYQFKVT